MEKSHSPSRGGGSIMETTGLPGPWEVVRVQGNKLLLRPCRPELPQKDLEAHAEDCVLVPVDADVADTREPIVFEDPKDDEEPSLGEQAVGESKQLEFTLILEEARPTRFALATSWLIRGVEGTSVVILEGLHKWAKHNYQFIAM